MTGQQLRSSILQEAIQGRLVPNVLQPGEKTGAELLQDIFAERQKKENEEKGKKVKKLSLSIIEEEPWELPDGWCWCVLPDVAHIEYGFPFDSTKFNTAEQGTPLIRIRDVVPGFTKTYTTERASAEYIIHKGDMLTGMDGNFNVNFWDSDDAYLNQRVCKITANPKIAEQRYLYYYLPVAFKEIEEDVSFVTVKHLSDKLLKALTVPLPPLSIQKAIVSKIDSLFPIVDEYDKAAGELKALNEALPDKLRKSVLQEAIHGNLVPNEIPSGEATAQELLQQILKERQDRENAAKGKKAKKLTLSEIEEESWELPEGWCWCTIGDLFDHTSGKQQSSSNKKVGTLQKYITTSNLYWGYFKLDVVKEMFFTDEEIRTCSATKGDLLVCEGGAGYGRSAIWDKDYDICLQNHVHRLRPIVPGICEYVYHIIYFLKETNQLASVGTAMPGLSANRLKEIQVPLPPLSIQKAIVAKIEEVFAAIDKLKA